MKKWLLAFCNLSVHIKPKNISWWVKTSQFFVVSPWAPQVMPISIIHILKYIKYSVGWNVCQSSLHPLSLENIKPAVNRKQMNTIPIFKYFYFLCQVTLSVSHDGYLHFGDTVCIYNPSTETTLAANMAESKMHDEKRLVGPCDVSASKIVDPCIRNTFMIGWVTMWFI